MSLRLMAEVWDYSKAEQGSLLVLLALADEARDNGRCFPSIARLAQKARLTDRQVQRVLQNLEEAGEIRIIRNGGSNKGGRGRTNEYEVTLSPNRTLPFEPVDNQPIPVDKPVDGKSVKGDILSVKGDISDIKGDTHVTRTVVNLKDKRVDVVDPQTPPPKPSTLSPAAKKGSRLTTDWLLPKAWGDWALDFRKDWTAPQVRLVADTFRDHWIAKPGAAGVKLDWAATWRNWVRKERQPTNLQAQATVTAPSKLAQVCCICAAPMTYSVGGKSYCGQHDRFSEPLAVVAA